MQLSQRYDVIVVGAGSSGCALAARLSERPDRRVLLVEAGQHFRAMEDFPHDLQRAESLAVSMPGHPQNWSFSGQLYPGRIYPMARGRVVGGSSAVNGTYFIRGHPADFDGWAEQGNDAWSYDRVLDYFKRSETDLNFRDAAHGSDGPIPVRRPPDSELHPLSQAFVEACLKQGFAADPDKNAGDRGPGGVGAIPRNCVNGLRMNTAVTYLNDCLKRENFTLLDRCEVERIVIEDGVAVAISAWRGDEHVRIEADEIALCAGGIKTPQLLQVSGIGPADLLRSHGIRVLRDAPVGRNVQDHPSIHLPFRAPRAEHVPLAPQATPIQVALNFTAPGSPDISDLQVNCVAATGAQMLASGKPSRLPFRIPGYLRRPLRTLKALSRLSTKVVLAEARSQNTYRLLCSLHLCRSRGEINITSPSARDRPAIDLNYLSHSDDLPRLRASVRQGIDLLHSEAFGKLGARVVAGDGELNSDDELDRWIRSNLGTAFHTSGAARMGPSDQDAVVDQYGRVYGVAGLRVCDLSICPTIVRRGPAATAVMIGERMADFF